jgi:hypothetical protein
LRRSFGEKTDKVRDEVLSGEGRDEVRDKVPEEVYGEVDGGASGLGTGADVEVLGPVDFGELEEVTVRVLEEGIPSAPEGLTGFLDKRDASLFQLVMSLIEIGDHEVDHRFALTRLLQLLPRL